MKRNPAHPSKLEDVGNLVSAAAGERPLGSSLQEGAPTSSTGHILRGARVHGARRGFEHAACGVHLSVPLPSLEATPTHAALEHGLRVLRDMGYRSGYNPLTGESDGAGIRIFPLPTAFLQGKFGDRSSRLVDGTYGLGHYFLPRLSESNGCQNHEAARHLVEVCAHSHGLFVAGWRDTTHAVNKNAVSAAALARQPAMAQVILQADHDITPTDLEFACLAMGLDLADRARRAGLALSVVSQSTTSVVYKGMILPNRLRDFFDDLRDPAFTAVATTGHVRFATNTAAHWSKAQPCPFVFLHNGELTSAQANAIEMGEELAVRHVGGGHRAGLWPSSLMSDSMQFDADIANQMVLHGASLAEALLRLMPPPLEVLASEEGRTQTHDSEATAMLAYFRLLRSPYNGPAFMIGSYGGFHILKSDNMGLRPTRWAITEHRTGRRHLHAASDDLVDSSIDTIVTKSNLAPGGMIAVAPDGRVLDTTAVLAMVLTEQRARHGYGQDHFRRLLQAQLVPLHAQPAQVMAFTPTLRVAAHAPDDLPRSLYAAFWDRETQDSVLYMAQHKAERLGAMGDDTNPLPSIDRPVHISLFFRQLFAQVSAPPLDSIRELDRFTLACTLGPRPDTLATTTQVALPSPILGPDDLEGLRSLAGAHGLAIYDADMTMPVDDAWDSTVAALEGCVDIACATGGVIIVSDQRAGRSRIAMPDVLALAVLRRRLASRIAGRSVSVVVDSWQTPGPHQAAVLLAVGANAIFPRGAYACLRQLAAEAADGPADPHVYINNYRAALDKCLLKTMGKIGVTDVTNYIQGKQLAVLGIDVSDQRGGILSHVFGEYANEFGLRGLTHQHLAAHSVQRHREAYAETRSFSVLPRAGHYMPEKGGVVHGYGPEVVAAFTMWMKQEDVRTTQYQLHRALVARGLGGFVADADTLFAPARGFLNPGMRAAGVAGASYPPEYLETVQVSKAFAELIGVLDEYAARHPTALRDYLRLRVHSATVGSPMSPSDSTQSTASIRATFFSGSMSQGALTVSEPDTPDWLGAHETLTRAANAVGVNSASGEGGEAASDLRDPARSTRSKQVASGRFGVSAVQIGAATEIEIKVAQGAKPGEGGELPKSKVTVRIAAQRGSLPGTGLVSPPPHHDIYSIEDLEQLIWDIRSVNPAVRVCVKLVASDGIGTIAVGVAKAGADVINIAGHSGGTAAAQQSSIKHAGLPAELALLEVGRCLDRAHLRNRVHLRTSGGLKTPEDVIKAAILGADLFEFGTTAMLSLGCKMQRTCNQSCKPGVATDSANFAGDRLHTERYFVFLAAGVRERLCALQVPSLAALRGRTDLVDLSAVHTVKADQVQHSCALELHGIATALLGNVAAPPAPGASDVDPAPRPPRPLDDALVIEALGRLRASGATISHAIELTAPRPLRTTDRAFGARLSGMLARELEAMPAASVIVHSCGVGIQSLAFALSAGLVLDHVGTAGEGCGKSMSGGTLVVRAEGAVHDRAHVLMIAGNAAMYGASGGRAFFNGKAGHRFGILLKGAEVVVEGVGDLAFEYMTSGTALVLGPVGRGLGVGASGGVIIVHDPARTAAVSASGDVRVLSSSASVAYAPVVRTMLEAHIQYTRSVQASNILAAFDIGAFSIFLPIQLDSIDNPAAVASVLHTMLLRHADARSPAPRSAGIADPSFAIVGDTTETDHDFAGENGHVGGKGMRVWLEQAALSCTQDVNRDDSGMQMLRAFLMRVQGTRLLSRAVWSQLERRTRLQTRASTHADNDCLEKTLTDRAEHASAAEADAGLVTIHRVQRRSVGRTRSLRERLSGVHGVCDEDMLDVLAHLGAYASQLATDASGCSGCRAQSCAGTPTVTVASASVGCPGGKSINTINALLKSMGVLPPGTLPNTAQWIALRRAFEVQTETTPFIAYTGAACPAPCEGACTESIAGTGLPEPQRGGKPAGEPVQIRRIEYSLFKLGRAMGWWSPAHAAVVAPALERMLGTSFAAYHAAMVSFQPPFTIAVRRATKSVPTAVVIVVGSGPAGMQVAYQALRDGLRVCMYERSDQPGGLLVDAIPRYKFDEAYLRDDFAALTAMGLELHLNAEVAYDALDGSFRLSKTGERIARAHDPTCQIVLCVGAGPARHLPAAVTAALPVNGPHQASLVPATTFLKAANDVARVLQSTGGSIDATAQNAIIRARFGQAMDPRGKRIVVIGGGDTAQDAIRWLARYFANPAGGVASSTETPAQQGMHVLVRGPAAPHMRGIVDGYPAVSLAPTKENVLRAAEVEYVGGSVHHLVETVAVVPDDEGSDGSVKVAIHLRMKQLAHSNAIHADPELLDLASKLPRDKWPAWEATSSTTIIRGVDLVLLALGFEAGTTVPLVAAAQASGANNVYIVGDASDSAAKIIIGAQANAKDTYEGLIRKAAFDVRMAGVGV